MKSFIRHTQTHTKKESKIWLIGLKKKREREKFVIIKTNMLIKCVTLMTN